MMKNSMLPKTIQRILAFTIVLMLVSACGSAPTPTPVTGEKATPVTSATVQATSLPAYPPAYNQGGYPVPGGSQSGAQPTPTEGPLPTSSSGGTVTGTLLAGTPLQPVPRYPLFLGKVLLLQSGEEGMVSLNKGSAPRAIWGADGKFVFINVPDGKYAFVLDMVVATIVLKDPQTGKDFLVEIKGGNRIDFGEMKYPELKAQP